MKNTHLRNKITKKTKRRNVKILELKRMNIYKENYKKNTINDKYDINLLCKTLISKNHPCIILNKRKIIRIYLKKVMLL